ncbi:hypothetical protein SARC_05280 [Sphaeroforma arctica JP610]|uniref:Uncharacterized protein n=1 Tax=Sphaeroforma arctica JP610 TaxID=667725 RepID=A0A0L0G034_9EUKA|nr:hypothetical protein SARC_05280 [Sphaeroforma arctica JP610]KNC82430.1 hypothetical protein SARC_05280 [Sphaeroforma arctica JP610]|eukprot:XP_014156332.1 hypothetical protein SARC_05280 [Sphaeroforma arctica JP610]
MAGEDGGVVNAVTLGRDNVQASSDLTKELGVNGIEQGTCRADDVAKTCSSKEPIVGNHVHNPFAAHTQVAGSHDNDVVNTSNGLSSRAGVLRGDNVFAPDPKQPGHVRTLTDTFARHVLTCDESYPIEVVSRVRQEEHARAIDTHNPTVASDAWLLMEMNEWGFGDDTIANANGIDVVERMEGANAEQYNPHMQVDEHNVHTQVYDHGTYTKVDELSTHMQGDDNNTHTQVDDHVTHTRVDDHNTHVQLDVLSTHTQVDELGTHAQMDDHNTSTKFTDQEDGTIVYEQESDTTLEQPNLDTGTHTITEPQHQLPLVEHGPISAVHIAPTPTPCDSVGLPHTHTQPHRTPMQEVRLSTADTPQAVANAVALSPLDGETYAQEPLSAQSAVTSTVVGTTSPVLETETARQEPLSAQSAVTSTVVGTTSLVLRIVTATQEPLGAQSAVTSTVVGTTSPVLRTETATQEPLSAQSAVTSTVAGTTNPVLRTETATQGAEGVDGDVVSTGATVAVQQTRARVQNGMDVDAANVTVHATHPRLAGTLQAGREPQNEIRGEVLEGIQDTPLVSEKAERFVHGARIDTQVSSLVETTKDVPMTKHGMDAGVTNAAAQPNLSHMAGTLQASGESPNEIHREVLECAQDDPALSEKVPRETQAPPIDMQPSGVLNITNHIPVPDHGMSSPATAGGVQMGAADDGSNGRCTLAVEGVGNGVTPITSALDKPTSNTLTPNNLAPNNAAANNLAPNNLAPNKEEQGMAPQVAQNVIQQHIQLQQRATQLQLEHMPHARAQQMKTHTRAQHMTTHTRSQHMNTHTRAQRMNTHPQPHIMNTHIQTQKTNTHAHAQNKHRLPGRVLKPGPYAVEHQLPEGIVVSYHSSHHVPTPAHHVDPLTTSSHPSEKHVRGGAGESCDTEHRAAMEKQLTGEPTSTSVEVASSVAKPEIETEKPPLPHPQPHPQSQSHPHQQIVPDRIYTHPTEQDAHQAATTPSENYHAPNKLSVDEHAPNKLPMENHAPNKLPVDYSVPNKPLVDYHAPNRPSVEEYAANSPTVGSNTPDTPALVTTSENSHGHTELWKGGATSPVQMDTEPRIGYRSTEPVKVNLEGNPYSGTDAQPGRDIANARDVANGRRIISGMPLPNMGPNMGPGGGKMRWRVFKGQPQHILKMHNPAQQYRTQETQSHTGPYTHRGESEVYKLVRQKSGKLEMQRQVMGVAQDSEATGHATQSMAPAMQAPPMDMPAEHRGVSAVETQATALPTHTESRDRSQAAEIPPPTHAGAYAHSYRHSTAHLETRPHTHAQPLEEMEMQKRSRFESHTQAPVVTKHSGSQPPAEKQTRAVAPADRDAHAQAYTDARAQAYTNAHFEVRTQAQAHSEAYQLSLRLQAELQRQIEAQSMYTQDHTRRNEGAGTSSQLHADRLRNARDPRPSGYTQHADVNGRYRYGHIPTAAADNHARAGVTGQRGMFSQTRNKPQKRKAVAITAHTLTKTIDRVNEQLVLQAMQEISRKHVRAAVFEEVAMLNRSIAGTDPDTAVRAEAQTEGLSSINRAPSFAATASKSHVASRPIKRIKMSTDHDMSSEPTTRKTLPEVLTNPKPKLKRKPKKKQSNAKPKTAPNKPTSEADIELETETEPEPESEPDTRAAYRPLPLASAAALQKLVPLLEAELMVTVGPDGPMYDLPIALPVAMEYLNDTAIMDVDDEDLAIMRELVLSYSVAYFDMLE